MREGHQGLARSFSCYCYSLFAFYLESETLVTFYLESESSFVSTLSVNSGSYSQFLKRAVSRKYSKIWFRFTSEIKVEQENYHNEIRARFVFFIFREEKYLQENTTQNDLIK